MQSTEKSNTQEGNTEQAEVKIQPSPSTTEQTTQNTEDSSQSLKANGAEGNTPATSTQTQASEDTVQPAEKTENRTEDEQKKPEQTTLKACLVYALRLCGVMVTEESLLGERAAFNLDNINALGAQAGYTVKPGLGVDSLDSLMLPAIVQFANGAFGVVTKIDGNEYTVWTGEVVEIVDIRNDFNTLFLPKYLTVAKIEHDYGPDFLTPAWFFQQIKNLWPAYSQIIFVSVFINCFTLVIPIFMGIFYDRVLPNLAQNSLFVLVTGAALILLFDFLLKNVRSTLVERAAIKVERTAEPMLMQQILGIRLTELPQSAGKLVNTVQDLSRIKNLFTTQIILGVIDFFFLGFFLLFIYFNSSLLFLVPMICAFITIAASYIFAVILDKNITSQMQLQSRKTSFLNEIFSSLESIKASNGEKSILNSWNTEVFKSSLVSSKYRATQAKCSYTVAFLGQLNTVMLILVAFYLISEGSISSGSLLTTMVLSGRVIAVAASVANLVTSYMFAKRSGEELKKLLELEQEEPQGQTYYPEKIIGDISFKNVNFRYDPKLPYTLQDISFDIKHGERIGIIGPTGSGKSTLLKLITGLAAPSEGIITFDNYNLHHLTLSRVRQFMGVIPQSPVLLQGTLESNLLISGAPITRATLEFALKISGLTKLVQQNPLGLKMQISEGGLNLSRGQRQAVCLARAIIGQPRMLFMDEPTSSMDTLSEDRFIRGVKGYMKDQLLIVVTHRKKILSLVDRVIVLENGRISYDGPTSGIIKKTNA